jgi:putative ABC transport system permease protein
LVGTDALRATGLLQPGSVVRWHYRVRLPGDASDSAVKAVTAQAHAALPDAGWEIRTRANASPQLERNIERFSEYLTLVGLTALLVGGVGIANAVKHYLDRKRDVIATLKSLGATGGDVFAIYLVQVLVLALAGTAIGIVAGAALPFAIAEAFKTVLPIPVAPALHPGELALAAV